MEDAHITLEDVRKAVSPDDAAQFSDLPTVSVFGVFDGHGGIINSSLTVMCHLFRLILFYLCNIQAKKSRNSRN
jgi:hypothetical protein